MKLAIPFYMRLKVIEHFFVYFRNYEDDMIRIIGYLGTPLLNEYGGLLEKSLQNE